MTIPKAVVVPFGVPDDGRGLGIGLAALVHGFAQIDGESVALAQLFSRASPDSSEAHEHEGRASDAEPVANSSPVEAFIPPQAWRDLAGHGAAPPVSVVVTGAFEPPTAGRGLIQILAFDTRDGRTKAIVEAPVEGEHAGASLLKAFEEILGPIGAQLGAARDIHGLNWEALESVLRAERCVLFDPARGGPHDRLAAMAHLERAIGDAPDARFPASRLAALAIELASSDGGNAADGKLADAAQRALLRARDDAPTSPDLIEALAALSLRRGDREGAEALAREALALDSERPRLYSLLSEIKRLRGDLEGALASIEEGLVHGSGDPLLNTERGIVLAERGSQEPAEKAWRMVLDMHPLYPPAYLNLAAAVQRRNDAVQAALLVDEVLQHPNPHPEVLRRAIALATASEPEGVARAARVAKLAAMLIDRVPSEGWGRLVLARALEATGDKSGAIKRLLEIEQVARATPLAAEAQRTRLGMEAPTVSLEIDAVLRAAQTAAVEDLETIGARARTLAMTHGAWPAWFALGMVEKRRERWQTAREALTEALSVAPGSAPVHLELVNVLIALERTSAAVEHARRACSLEGDSARSLAVLATALLAAGDRDQAVKAMDRALSLDASDEANRALASLIHRGSEPPVTTSARLRGFFGRRWGR
jgi:tetratricopeptide (TPR) repeat protein